MIPIIVWILSILLAGVQAHMQLYYPAPFNASNNPHLTGPCDSEILFPYDCCGKTTRYPCRGYLDLLGTPEGAPVATWAAGSQQSWSIWGPAPYGGNHWGGSCQVGFSVDNGTTFRVVTSYEGDCPKRYNGWTDPANQTFPFTVPADLPNGDVIFAWTWYNREQEFFMNCAAVTITNGGGSTSANPDTVSASTYGTAPTTPIQGSSTAASTTTLVTLTTIPSPAPTSSGVSFTLGSCNCTCAASSPELSQLPGVHLSGCSCDCPSEPSSAPQIKPRRIPLEVVGTLTSIPANLLASPTPTPMPTTSGHAFNGTLGVCNCTCTPVPSRQEQRVGVGHLHACLCDCPSQVNPRGIPLELVDKSALVASPTPKLIPRWLPRALYYDFFRTSPTLYHITHGLHSCVCAHAALQIHPLKQHMAYKDCSCVGFGPALDAEEPLEDNSEGAQRADEKDTAIAKALVKRGDGVAFNDRPLMFIADISNGCETPRTTAELKYPQPGPDVVMGDGVYPLEGPTGNCSY